MEEISCSKLQWDKVVKIVIILKWMKYQLIKMIIMDLIPFKQNQYQCINSIIRIGTK
jgi:hypothetical protein